MSVIRKTSIGSSFQFDLYGNALAGTPQTTTVQLGALNNTSSFYRDPTNPCQTTGQTNKASSFINKQLIYMFGQGGGSRAVSLDNANPHSIYAPASATWRGPSVVQTNTFGAQGFIVADGKFYGNGGTGGTAYVGYYPGVSNGGDGQYAILYSGGPNQVTISGSGSVYGGGGGGGSGGYGIFGYGIYFSGGGGGGGASYAFGGQSINPGWPTGQPGATASLTLGGAGGSAYFPAGPGGPGGGVGQQGIGGGTGYYYDSGGGYFPITGGAAGGTPGPPVSGAQVTWQLVNHN